MSLRLASITLLCLWATNAYAQPEDGGAIAEPDTDLETEPAATDEPAEPVAEVEASRPKPVPEASALATHKIGFRNGFSLSAGQESGTTAAGADISGQLYGLDWRIGTGVSDAISVYLHTHLSFGTASVGGGSGSTGNFATALVGEYLLPARVFFGGGFGYGVLNNPSGPLAELRVGYYPFKHNAAGAARRLNVALDARWYFVDDAGTGVTVTHLALSLGYDRF